MHPVTITVTEAAVYLGVSTDTLYDMARRKEIPHIRIRRRIFFRWDTLDRWLREQEKMSVQKEKRQAM